MGMSRASDASEGKCNGFVSSPVMLRGTSGQIFKHLTAMDSLLALVQMVLVTMFYLHDIIAFSPLATTMY